jgi:uncharacterized membrane protein
MADGWNGGWWFWPFGVFFSIFLFFLVMRLVFWRRGWGWWGHAYPHYGAMPPAEEILRARLARGEIDEAEYERVKAILRK